MKRLSLASFLFSAALGFTVLVGLRACAQDSTASRFYLKSDIGGNLTRDTDLREYFGPVSPGSRVTFEPGFRFGLAGGFWVTDWLGTEVETGVLANDIRSITGADLLDASFSNVPLLANVRLQLPGNYRVTPYIGGGAGGSISVLNADTLVLNDIHIHGSAADAVFAYQAFGGVRCRITDHLALGIEYRYFATQSPSLRADFVGSGIPSDRIRLGGAQTHSFSLLLSFTF